MKALATEMTKNFGERLGRLGLTVKELTGDMQLTKTEILNTQMLVTTPEKWDVVTRKGTGDVALTQLVKLLILDEVNHTYIIYFSIYFFTLFYFILSYLKCTENNLSFCLFFFFF